MEIRPISENYAVAPQINADDMAAIRAAGYVTVICNRPDREIPPEQQRAALEDAAKAAGLAFVFLPATYETMTEDLVARQAAAIEAADGPVLAYCASGTRSTVIWSLSKAGALPVGDILMAAAKAGYDLAGLRPRLEAMSKGT